LENPSTTFIEVSQATNLPCCSSPMRGPPAYRLRSQRRAKKQSTKLSQ
jgi:hypothetical protein